MKRKIQLAIAAVVLIVGAVVFYFYFPEIWGEAIYPLEYKEEILSASKEFNIDRNLIAAVIYTESHFNKDASLFYFAYEKAIILQHIPNFFLLPSRKISYISGVKHNSKIFLLTKNKDRSLTC